jgi:catechol 2,3-dioxygenase-like lactoylglutathione lyase family enzyme
MWPYRIDQEGAHHEGMTATTAICRPPAQRLLGPYHASLPVTDVESAADWFATVLGFEQCFLIEEGNRVVGAQLEHANGTVVVLRADPARAAALSGFPALAFGVPDREALRHWADHLSDLGVIHTEVSAAHLGWEVRLWGPDMIELRLSTGRQPVHA